MIKQRARQFFLGLCSLAAGTVNLAQSSEMMEDVLHGTGHFAFPKQAKVLIWLFLVLLAAQEVEKARFRLTGGKALEVN